LCGTFMPLKSDMRVNLRVPLRGCFGRALVLINPNLQP
jgi:hypothetical protein